MGGCYTDYSPCVRRDPLESADAGIKKFFRSGESSDMVAAYRAYCDNAGTSKGFIARVAGVKGISDVTDIPKEFDTIEYEVKFDIGVNGSGKEPGLEAFLDAFDFPAATSARFIKDPVHNIAEGVNHFYGDDLDEKLVVIAKAGRTYLKEKGPVLPVSVGVPYEQVVIKRTENRYAADIGEIVQKVGEAAKEQNAVYRGKLRKEKGDDFVLDLNDGRIYSFTITRAHLTLPGEKKESGIQRQLEIEYAGHIPGFKGFEKDSEKQIVEGMVDLAKYVHVLYHNAPLGRGWRMDMKVTSQRKYDFIVGSQSGDPARILSAGQIGLDVRHILDLDRKQLPARRR